MNKIVFTFILLFLGQGLHAQNLGISFNSSDSVLETAFNRAKEMALSYKGKPGDPVGLWYESALPPRSAFCMRDVAHQSIGGEILGLKGENKNMIRLFVENITDEKDWCTYWEIDHLGLPAKEDYRNDKEFWYNLNANFDILNACWELYLWTGDEEYINGPEFINFHEKSVNEFIERWALQTDSLLTRDAHINAPIPFNNQDNFHRCRGLPSYSEGVPNIKMGVDLVAAIYRGLMSYASILDVNGKTKEANSYRKKANEYQRNIETLWWNSDSSRYHTFYSNADEFGFNEGETFLLWFDALNEGERKQKTIQHLLNNSWNVENLSYFPLIMYENGQADKAHDYMLYLTDPSTKRREYPEVSYGVMKGFVQGLMGVSADSGANRVTTIHRSKAERSQLDHLPVLKTLVSLTHEGNEKSTLSNEGTHPVLWRAEFAGHYSLQLNSDRVESIREKDALGNTITHTEVWVMPGDSIEVSLLQ